MEVMMKNWMSDNSKEHYGGIPNNNEIQELIGRISAGIGLILFIIFIIAMLI